eukprot:TRINITY_DN2320_c0_g1_i2.p1 TRINITY_DN2320_c0_g1~~TRINITY_DN2320_c0_g1_i2.p1  ORF type:complete len:3638 (+),score=457.03 TRINITY_DN2320_c0_g1_i2:486-11399(+)
MNDLSDMEMEEEQFSPLMYRSAISMTTGKCRTFSGDWSSGSQRGGESSYDHLSGRYNGQEDEDDQRTENDFMPRTGSFQFDEEIFDAVDFDSYHDPEEELQLPSSPRGSESDHETTGRPRLFSITEVIRRPAAAYDDPSAPTGLPRTPRRNMRTSLTTSAFDSTASRPLRRRSVTGANLHQELTRKRALSIEGTSISLRQSDDGDEHRKQVLGRMAVSGPLHRSAFSSDDQPMSRSFTAKRWVLDDEPSPAALNTSLTRSNDSARSTRSRKRSNSETDLSSHSSHIEDEEPSPGGHSSSTDRGSRLEPSSSNRRPSAEKETGLHRSVSETELAALTRRPSSFDDVVNAESMDKEVPVYFEMLSEHVLKGLRELPTSKFVVPSDCIDEYDHTDEKKSSSRKLQRWGSIAKKLTKQKLKPRSTNQLGHDVPIMSERVRLMLSADFISSQLTTLLVQCSSKFLEAQGGRVISMGLFFDDFEPQVNRYLGLTDKYTKSGAPLPKKLRHEFVNSVSIGPENKTIKEKESKLSSCALAGGFPFTVKGIECGDSSVCAVTADGQVFFVERAFCRSYKQEVTGFEGKAIRIVTAYGQMDTVFIITDKRKAYLFGRDYRPLPEQQTPTENTEGEILLDGTVSKQTGIKLAKMLGSDLSTSTSGFGEQMSVESNPKLVRLLGQHIPTAPSADAGLRTSGDGIVTGGSSGKIARMLGGKDLKRSTGSTRSSSDGGSSSPSEGKAARMLGRDPLPLLVEKKNPLSSSARSMKVSRLLRDSDHRERRGSSAIPEGHQVGLNQSKLARMLGVNERGTEDDSSSKMMQRTVSSVNLPRRSIGEPFVVRELTGITGSVIQIAAGQGHTLVVTTTGVFSYGQNKSGQCGVTHFGDGPLRSPQLIPGLTRQKVIQVCCGAFHSLAVTDGGAVFGWGMNVTGQCGFHPSHHTILKPRRISTLQDVVVCRVAAGESHSAGLDARSEMYCWGSNRYGELGRKDKSCDPRVVKRLVGKTLWDIDCGDYTSACSTDMGEAYMWGRMSKNFHKHTSTPSLLTAPYEKSFFVRSIRLGKTHCACLVDAGLSDTLRAFLDLYRKDQVDMKGILQSYDGDLNLWAREQIKMVTSDIIARVLLNQASFRLILARKRLRALPVGIGKKTPLEHLDVSFNRISSVIELCALVNLVDLKVSHNQLESIPDGFRGLIKLQYADLSHNKIKQLPLGIGSWKNVRVLLLNDNQLASLIPSIGQMRSLEKLHLQNNHLQELPNQLGSLSLESLRVENNPLGKLPPEIRADEESILAWLRALSEGTEPCYRVKVMVVGDENVGKTSLLTCLKEKRTGVFSKKKEDTIATDGIDISDWSEQVLTADNKKVDININAWDFAGQEVYYTTHQFFLSNRSIYLVTFSLDCDDYTRVLYWIQSIFSKVTRPTVLVVGTHLDSKHVTGQLLNEVSNRLGNMIKESTCYRRFNPNSILYVSCKTDKGIDEMRARILEVAMQQEHMGQEFPRSYLLLEQQVIVASRITVPPTINWKEWEEMGKKCGIAPDALPQATQFLTDLGVVVYFNDDKLRDTVILDPHFITKAMASVISVKNVFIKKGVIRSVDWPLLWRPPLFPESIHEPLLKLLEAFEVVHPVRADIVMPDYIDDEQANGRLSGSISPTSRGSRIGGFCGARPPSATVGVGGSDRIILSNRQKRGGESGRRRSAGSESPGEPVALDDLVIGGLKPSSASVTSSSPVPAFLSNESPLGSAGATPATRGGYPSSVQPSAQEARSGTSTPESPAPFQSLLSANSGKLPASPSSAPSTPNPPASVYTAAVAAAAIPGSKASRTPTVSTRFTLVPSLLPKDKPSLVEVWNKSHADQFGRVFMFGFIPLGFFSRLLARLFHVGGAVQYWQNGIVSDHEGTRTLVELYPDTQEIKIHTAGTEASKYLLILTQIVDGLIRGTMSAGSHIPTFAVCYHCLMTTARYPSMFSMETCLEAMSAMKPFLYCQGFRPVPVSRLVPDLKQMNIPRIERTELKVKGVIARGGFGEVLLASYKNQHVAVKRVIASAIDTQKEASQKNQELISEAWYMSSLKHGNLVQMRGVCVDPVCLVLEYLPHGDLYRFLRTGRMSLHFAYRIALDIAQGMHFLHFDCFPPILHRDLKSPNILMASPNPNDPVVAKISDLGSSMIFYSSLSGGVDAKSDWSPPEVLTWKHYGQAADVYSFGIVLWELVACSHPFAEFSQFKSDFRKKAAISDGGLRPSIPSDCPPGLKSLMIDCWSGKPTDRPDFREILRRIKAEFDTFLSSMEVDPSLATHQLGSQASPPTESGKKKRARRKPTLDDAKDLPSQTISSDIFDATSEDPSCSPSQVMRRRAQTPPIHHQEEKQLVAPEDKQEKAKKAEDEGLTGERCAVALYRELSATDCVTSSWHRCGVVSMVNIGGFLWAGCEGGQILVWKSDKASTSLESLMMKAHTHKASIVSLLSVNDEVWSGSMDGTIRVWKAEYSTTWKCTEVCCIEAPGPVFALIRTSQDHIWAMTNKLLLKFDIKTHELVKTGGLRTPAQCFCSFDTFVLVGCVDGRVEQWSIDTMKLSGSFMAYDQRSVTSVATVGDEIWTGSVEGEIRIWRGETCTLVDQRLLPISEDSASNRRCPITCITTLRENVIAGSSDGSVHMWNHKTLVHLSTVQPSNGYGVYGVATVSTLGSNVVQVWVGCAETSINCYLVKDMPAAPFVCFKPEKLPNYKSSVDFGHALTLFRCGPDARVLSYNPGADMSAAGLQVPRSASTAFGTSVTTYDKNLQTGQRMGDPIADTYAVEQHGSWSLIALADGVSWGEKATNASACAVASALKYSREKLSQLAPSSAVNEGIRVSDIGRVLLDAFPFAEDEMMKQDNVGFTDLIIAVTTPVASPSRSCPDCVVVCASYGVSHAFIWSKETRRVKQVTAFVDLKTFLGKKRAVHEPVYPVVPALSFYPCDKGDVLFCVSDGILLNFAPDILKVSPRALGMLTDDWHDAGSRPGFVEMRRRFSEELIEDVLSDGEKTSTRGDVLDAREVCVKLCEFAEKVTEEKRQFLEANSLVSATNETAAQVRGVQRQLKSLRGHLDHATAVAITVAANRPNEPIPYSISQCASPRKLSGHAHSPRKRGSSSSSNTSASSPSLSGLAAPLALTNEMSTSMITNVSVLEWRPQGSKKSVVAHLDCDMSAVIGPDGIAEPGYISPLSTSPGEKKKKTKSPRNTVTGAPSSGVIHSVDLSTRLRNSTSPRTKGAASPRSTMRWAQRQVRFKGRKLIIEKPRSSFIAPAGGMAAVLSEDISNDVTLAPTENTGSIDGGVSPRSRMKGSGGGGGGLASPRKPKRKGTYAISNLSKAVDLPLCFMLPSDLIPAPEIGEPAKVEAYRLGGRQNCIAVNVKAITSTGDSSGGIIIIQAPSIVVKAQIMEMFNRRMRSKSTTSRQGSSENIGLRDRRESHGCTPTSPLQEVRVDRSMSVSLEEGLNILPSLRNSMSPRESGGRRSSHHKKRSSASKARERNVTSPILIGRPSAGSQPDRIRTSTTNAPQPNMKALEVLGMSHNHPEAIRDPGERNRSESVAFIGAPSSKAMELLGLSGGMKRSNSGAGGDGPSQQPILSPKKRGEASPLVTRARARGLSKSSNSTPVGNSDLSSKMTDALKRLQNPK